MNKTMELHSWADVLVGLERNFLSNEKVMESLTPAFLNSLTTEQIGDFLLKCEGSKENLCNWIQEEFFIDSEAKLHAINRWALSFLGKIIISEKDKIEKLKDVANVWALFEYPKEWRPFIHYLPQPYNLSGIDVMYENLMKFHSAYTHF
jgi:hypothetical protein